MKDDYIRRSAAVACCGDYLPGSKLIAEEIAQISAEADVVKVVRCKACAYAVKHNNHFTGNPYLRCMLIDRNVPPKFYCEYGERKEDDREN